jgi:hypothetical protein
VILLIAKLLTVTGVIFLLEMSGEKERMRGEIIIENDARQDQII